MDFTDEQITRYSRHILLPEVGGKGQKKIAKSRILIVGAGGLGSPAALYLAAAGVGTIGIIGRPRVSMRLDHSKGAWNEKAKRFYRSGDRVSCVCRRSVGGNRS